MCGGTALVINIRVRVLLIFGFHFSSSPSSSTFFDPILFNFILLYVHSPGSKNVSTISTYSSFPLIVFNSSSLPTLSRSHSESPLQPPHPQVLVGVSAGGRPQHDSRLPWLIRSSGRPQHDSTRCNWSAGYLAGGSWILDRGTCFVAHLLSTLPLLLLPRPHG